MSGKNKFIVIGQMLSLLSQLGIMMIIPIIGCTFIGKFLDDKLNTSPFLLLVFLILGIGGGFSSVYKTLRVYIKRK